MCLGRKYGGKHKLHLLKIKIYIFLLKRTITPSTQKFNLRGKRFEIKEGIGSSGRGRF